MPNSGKKIFMEFISDYFAECEEHLAGLRRGLLALDQAVRQEKVGADLLNNLLRSFHTIKGLSGMVGQKETQELAHEMESYLRLLLTNQHPHTSEAQGAMVDGVKMLEQVLAAYQAGCAVPDIGPVMAALTRVGNGSPAPHPSGQPDEVQEPEPVTTEPPSLNEAPPGTRLWRFEFVPDPRLSEQGINVNVIRSRFQEIGKVLKAGPKVAGEGKISFEFLVATNREEEAFAGWRQDGVTYELAQPRRGNADRSPGPGSKPASINSMHPISLMPASTVRVDLTKLDDLMQMLGELVINRASMDNNLKEMENLTPSTLWQSIQENNLAMDRQLRALREGVMRVRMVPIGEVFERLRFGAYDLGREQQKDLVVEMEGQATEIDKFVVDKIMDPMLHLVRNMVSHGLEPEGERLAAGKPAQGKILLKAAMAGDVVVIDIADDGRGLDLDRVSSRARALGLLKDEAQPDMATVLDIICEPGFSTKDQADLASGRGVGMTVVKNAVQELGGTLSMDTQTGMGARFTIQLPLTLAIVDALIIKVGEQTFAVPIAAVREVIEIIPERLTVLENAELLNYREGVLPLIRLTRFFGLPENGKPSSCALVVGAAQSPVGLTIDRVQGQRAIVVHALNDPLIKSPGFAGATELGDGRGILILNVTGLIDAFRRARKYHGEVLSGGEDVRK